MDRGVPVMPDDDQAAKIVRSRLWTKRTHGTSPHSVYLSDFHADRVDLQRPDNFIKHAMFQIVQAGPDFLTAEPEYGGTGTRFLVQPFPART
jgi:hypothetical protein